MAQIASRSQDPSAHDGAGNQPRIVRGAEDQAAAYEAWLHRWSDADPEEDEQEWRLVQQNLQQTRRELGQRLLFPE